MKELISKQEYALRADETGLTFVRDGKDFLSVPAAVSFNGELSSLRLESVSSETVIYSARSERFTVKLSDDCAVVSYTRSCAATTPVYVVKAFTDGNKAIELKGFDRAFCTQPRNNEWRNMDYYNHLPDISPTGYFSPPIMQFSIGCPDGWASFGLLELPDSKICRMDEDHSFLIESCGGNKVVPAGGEYVMPGVLISFPRDEWDAISFFREKLIEFGLYTPSKPKFSGLPDWWKNPFVCTYGDQLIEDRVGQRIDEEWVSEFVDVAARDWGLENINLIIDDSWQLPHAFEPIADVKRFPDFRGFIDRMHEKGNHVILWQTPLFDKVTNGFVTRAQRMGVLSECEFKSPLWGDYFEEFPGCFAIDYTSDNARDFIREVVETLFGSGEGQYDADGIKLDFLGLLRDPAETDTYAHPERGVGVKELLLFYQMFSEEAKKVKRDVILSSTSGDPRFEHCLDFNRMHDVHCGTIEKEMRARLASLGCPGLPIDSDGALMYNSWLKVHYISAAVYSVPSIYYLKKMHDAAKRSWGEDPEINDVQKDLGSVEKKQLGALLGMARYRPDGNAFMESFGNWVLKDGDRVNAITQRGETVVYYPTEKNSTGYIFTWQDEVISIPLHGRKISRMDPSPKKGYLLVDYARDTAIMRLSPGVVHTFENVDAGDSIDRIFAKTAIHDKESK